MIKLKETKAQDLAFAHAQAGMGGVRFRGVSDSRVFWKMPDLLAKKSGNTNNITGAQVQQLIKSFG